MGRGKKTIINTISSIAEELIAILCGLVLPRLILSAFGSQYNGLTSSISQFLGYIVLLKAGVGGATRAALYKPLAEHDNDKINAIVKATDQYMKKVGLIMGGAILFLAVVYPFAVSDEFEWFFTFSLFIIIGLSTFAESFFGATYSTLLHADQKLWVSSILSCICYILNTVVCVILIKMGCSIHIVKLGSAVVYVVKPIILRIYCIRNYHIDLNVKPDNNAISQRWDAFWQQIATFVMNNTDVLILTLFSNLTEVSVYSVYNLITNGLKRAVQTITNSLEAPFGDMIAKGETKNVKTNIEIVEFLVYSLCTIIYTTGGLLVLDFVCIYTYGINDANYIRPAFAYLTMVSMFFYGIRLPYQLIVQAAGHYKQTKRGAIIEPIINICLSVLCVIKWGLVGVTIGTLVAIIFRTVQYSTYASKNIIYRNVGVIWKKIIISFSEAILIILVVSFLPLPVPSNFLIWIFNAIVVFGISVIITLAGCTIFYNQTFKLCLGRIKGMLKKP